MSTIIFENENHKNVLLEDFDQGMAVQSNIHLIVHGDQAMLLDPGGHKAFNKALSSLASLIRVNNLKYIFLSHQDPDIVAAVNGWLMSTDAEAWVSERWLRFVPHFGVDRLVSDRLKAMPDQGLVLDLGGCPLKVLPAHFMHSTANFQVYDPESKILYSGDLGASLDVDYREVKDFAQHIQYMQGFHQRYMASNTVLQAWIKMVKDLDIEVMAPQHGAILKGREMVESFIAWCADLPCGIDLLQDKYKIPE